MGGIWVVVVQKGHIKMPGTSIKTCARHPVYNDLHVAGMPAGNGRSRLTVFMAVLLACSLQNQPAKREATSSQLITFQKALMYSGLRFW